jgi:hypothetical protein
MTRTGWFFGRRESHSLSVGAKSGGCAPCLNTGTDATRIGPLLETLFVQPWKLVVGLVFRIEKVS